MPDAGWLVVLEPDECMRLMATAPVGRIVFTEQALPAVQPVNFLVHEGAIVIRTNEGSKLAAAAEGAIVAFEADEIDPATHTGWNVTVVGPASVVSDPDAVAELSALPLQPWAPGVRDRFIRIEAKRVSGRRLENESPGIS